MLARTTIAVICTAFFFSSTHALAEEKLEEIFKKTGELAAAGKYPQALSELSWASQQLTKAHQEKLKSFLPAEVAGLTAKPPKVSGVMGMVTAERSYHNAAKSRLKLALIGASSGKGAASPGMGAFAGLARMAAMADPGADPVRVHGRRAQVMVKNGRLKVTLPLDSGMIISVEQSRGEAARDDAIAILEAMKLDELDKYISGK